MAMAVPAAIKKLMLDTVTIQLKSTEDAYGNQTYGTAFTVKCYVDRKEQRILSTGGEEMSVSGVQAYLAEDQPSLTPEAKIVLPDGTSPPIKVVHRPAWPDGSRHTVVYF